MVDLIRRKFLTCLTGIVAAPMIVKFDSIMPVKRIWTTFDAGMFYCPYVPLQDERFPGVIMPGYDGESKWLRSANVNL